MSDSRSPKPKLLVFRMDGELFVGTDPVDGVDYRIGWCGNGSYSHYTLSSANDPEMGWYVYVDEKDELYRAIYAAERRLVFKVEM
jgi:hypothetical protein